MQNAEGRNEDADTEQMAQVQQRDHDRDVDKTFAEKKKYIGHRQQAPGFDPATRINRKFKETFTKPAKGAVAQPVVTQV